MVEDKRDRNPLNAEKSPRNNEKFEYQPPPAQHVDDRWKYPDSDWGLMAKFRSQKQIYDAIYAKDAEYQTQVSKLNKIREDNQRRIQAEFDRQKSQYDHEKKMREEADQKRFNSIMSMDSGANSGNSGRISKVS